MGSNAANDVIMSGGDEAEGSETTVEIKIKTLDSQTYTLRVNKCVPVPALKEQIAIVTGVLSEQQRLICRGKILKDDQLLSAYHVEDGHTLHLVVRQPIHSPSPLPTSFMGSEGSSGLPATNSASSSVRNLGNHVAHSFVFETVNLADQGDPVAPELGRVRHQVEEEFLSSILNSIGVGTPSTGTDETRTEYRELGSERLGRASGDTAPSDTTQPQSNPAAPRFGFDPRQASFRFPSAVPFGSQHPAVIPDSLTTLYQYLSHMRNEFRREGFRDNGTENSSNSEAVDVHGREGQNQNSQTRSAASGQGGLPTPASLAEIALSTRQLLLEQAGRCLSQLARQLEDQTSVIDPQMRMNIQSSVMRSGVLLQDLGSLLLELGRTTMTLCIGQTPSEAVVNAGPAVFISPSGPNPMMVQPVPFYPGSSFGGIHMGNVNPGRSVEGEPLGSAFLPRNIDIRIRTGHTPPAATANLGEQGSAQQSQGQTDPARNSAGASFLHEALSGVPGGASFTGESGVRVVPIRTVVAVPSGVNRSPSNSSGNTVGLLYPLLARVQHLNAGTVNDARGSEASTEPHSGGSEIVSDPIVESALRSQNLESNNDGANRSSNNASTNSAPVVPGTSPSPNESAQYQGSFRIFISSQQRPSSNNNDSSTQAPDVQQIGDGSVPQMFSRLDQLFRAVRPAEQIPAGDTSRLGSVTGSAADQTGLTRDAEAQEASRVGHNQGIFFSSLVRQLMPFISQSPAPEGVSPTNPGSSTTQAEREDLTDSSSQHLRDPPEAPNSKRPKLE